MTAAERQEEILLGAWASRVSYKHSGECSVEWQYPAQKAEFEKLWSEAPEYFNKTRMNRFNEWKEFIVRRGYKPRVKIPPDAVKEFDLSEAERLEEIRLGKWACHNQERLLLTAEQQAEFCKLWAETPTYAQEYGRTYVKPRARKNITHIVNCTSVNFKSWKEFILRKGYKPRIEISQKEAQKTGLTAVEQLEEIRLGRWANQASWKLANWQLPEQRAEFNKIRSETPTYRQKYYRGQESSNSNIRFDRWKEFIARKGYKPRASISKRAAAQAGLTAAEQLEEIRLGQWAGSICYSRSLPTIELQVEFNKIRNETPAYAQKYHPVRSIQRSSYISFNKWKEFIARKGYKPRQTISPKVAEITGLSESERLEEIQLGKWASHTCFRPLPTAELQAEFNRIRSEMPTFVQKYQHISPRVSSGFGFRCGTAAKFAEWKEFIARYGYKPRQAVSREVALRSGISDNEKRLGKWATSANKRLDKWHNPERQAEFTRLWQETPRYTQKNPRKYTKGCRRSTIAKFEEWKRFITDNGYKPRQAVSKEKAIAIGLSEEEIRLGSWAAVARYRLGNWNNPELQAEFSKLWRETPAYVQKNKKANLE